MDDQYLRLISLTMVLQSVTVSVLWTWVAQVDRIRRPLWWAKDEERLERIVSQRTDLRTIVRTVTDKKDRASLVYDLTIRAEFRWSRFLRLLVGVLGSFTGVALGIAASLPSADWQDRLSIVIVGMATGALIVNWLDVLMKRFDIPAALIGNILVAEKFWERKSRLELLRIRAGHVRNVERACRRKGIPVYDIGGTHDAICSDGSWKRWCSMTLNRITRSYRGEYVGCDDRAAAAPQLPTLQMIATVWAPIVGLVLALAIAIFDHI